MKEETTLFSLINKKQNLRMFYLLFLQCQIDTWLSIEKNSALVLHQWGEMNWVSGLFGVGEEKQKMFANPPLNKQRSLCITLCCL